MLDNFLKSLELSEKEALVYLTMLRIGSQGVSIVAKKSGLSRTTCYHVLESLQKKGYVSSYEKNKIDYYNAESPEIFQYILEKKGFLAESVYAVTYITTKKTRRIATKRGNFIYRSIKEDLFFGFTAQTVDNAEYFVASLAKALFDFLYLTPWKTKQQMETFLKESRFNWKVLREKDKLEFKQIISQVKIKKMNTACQFLKEERMI